MWAIRLVNAIRLVGKVIQWLFVVAAGGLLLLLLIIAMARVVQNPGDYVDDLYMLLAVAVGMAALVGAFLLWDRLKAKARRQRAQLQQTDQGSVD